MLGSDETCLLRDDRVFAALYLLFCTVITIPWLLADLVRTCRKSTLIGKALGIPISIFGFVIIVFVLQQYFYGRPRL